MKSDSIVLEEHNYADWSVWAKSYLHQKNLWSVVKPREHPRQEDAEVSFEDHKGQNFKALRVIWSSCGQKAFSKIKGCTLASDAWNILEEKFAMLDNITKDNFVDWSARMKSYLMAQDLWSVVEARQREDEVVSKNWEHKNLKALQEIWSFCDQEALFEINEYNSAQEAWNALVEKYDVKASINTDNYADWSNRVKANLMGEGLWDVIESTTEPPKQKDDEVKFKIWKEKNSKAFQVIRSSCGWKAFFDINDISSAKIAWDTLAKKFGMQDHIKKGRDFVEAMQSGNWGDAEEFLGQDPSLVGAKITCWEETALHIAVAMGNHRIVEKSVDLMSAKDLETVDDDGYTAFAHATICGQLEMAKYMYEKNKNLIHIKDKNKRTPVVLAIEYRQKGLARHLYYQTLLEDLKQDKDIQYATICTQAIYNGMLDIAIDLIQRCPPLALALDLNNRSPFYALASTYAFLSRSRLGTWKRWIYHCYDHFSSINCSASSNDENHVYIRIEEIQTNGSVPSVLHKLVPRLSQNWEVYLEEKKSLELARKLLQLMSKQTSISTAEDMKNGLVLASLELATLEGMSDFLNGVFEENGSLKWTVDHKGRSIFSNAVLYGQAEILKNMLKSAEKDVLIKSLDDEKNNILHMAGMLAPPTHLNDLPGAALRMQSELRWFKEVKRIAPYTMEKEKNKDGFTPQQLFTEAHKELKKEGEKWMKRTATSCTVVAALIITIAFAAAFTVPGGFNSETGLPILLTKKLFKVYMVCDCISLIFSSMSVLMFLLILTSHYEEEDFLISLPMKLILGHYTLFFSILTMMIAFCAALGLMLLGQATILVSIIWLACLPGALLTVVQSHLLIVMANSTFSWSHRLPRSST